MFETAAGDLYPLRLSYERNGVVQLYLAHLAYRTPFKDLALRQRLYDELAAIVGPLSTKTLGGFPGFDARKLNDEEIVQALSVFVQRLLAEAHGG